MRAFLPRIGFLCCTLSFAMPGIACAEATETKRELIVEVIEATGGEELAVRISHVVLASLQPNYAATIEKFVASDETLTSEQRERVRAQLSRFGAFATEFSSRFAAAIDFDQVVENVYVPLYSESFGEDELREMLAFYRSPTGQKAIAVTPALMQQGLENTVSLVQDEIIDLVDAIFEEEKAAALH